MPANGGHDHDARFVDLGSATELTGTFNEGGGDDGNTQSTWNQKIDYPDPGEPAPDPGPTSA